MSEEEITEEVPKEEKPKKVKENKEKVGGFNYRMAKVGYMDAYDYITLLVGIWGFIWSLTGFLVTLPLQGPIIAAITGIIDQNFYAFMTWLGMNFLQLWIYVTLALFPFVIVGVGMKIVNKWPETFPLHFIKTAEDLRAFMVFSAWWSSLFFWIGSPWLRWPHFVSVVFLTIVLLADALHKKIRKMPRKKIREI
ncbi:hypothetical protein ES703_86919 [subsurface metagenome]